MTAFATGMLQQRRLDARLYDVFVKLMPAGKLTDSPSEDALVAAGLASFNDFYGEDSADCRMYNIYIYICLPSSQQRWSGCV